MEGRISGGIARRVPRWDVKAGKGFVVALDTADLEADFAGAASDWGHAIAIKRPTQTQASDGTETQSLSSVATVTGAWMPVNPRQLAQMSQRIQGFDGVPTHKAFLPGSADARLGDVLVYGTISARVLGKDVYPGHLQVWLRQED